MHEPEAHANANCDTRTSVLKKTTLVRAQTPPRKSKYGKWSLKDKNILLSVLQQYGHENIQKFTEALPGKTIFQIRYFLNKFRNIAAEKLKRKRDYNVQLRLENVHPWIPFMNMCCNVNPKVHNNLIAYIFPLIEQCSKHPEPKNVGNIDFKLAYRALFNSLTEQKFPDDMNCETSSMLYASIKHLLDDVRIENSDDVPILSKCVQRRLMSVETKNSTTNVFKERLLHLPEVNAFSLNEEEIKVLCKNRRMNVKNLKV